MIEVEKVKPSGLFTNYIFKAIPLAFDESMSYYECLCGLLNYMKNTIIPAVNNNADAVIEVQNLMVQLQNYVDNYFDNLDVQEEINKKLDEMVEDGTLTSLISTYLTPIINEQNRQIQLIDDKVTSATSGAPTPVDTVDEMIDTSKIYVLVTDGNWYYYDSTNETWTIGGVYQASQSTSDINETKSIVESVYNKSGIVGDVVEYENKTINTSTGVTTSSSTRILTKEYLPQNITKILINPSYQVALVVFDNTNTFKGVYRTGTHTVEPTSSFNWATNELVVPYDLILSSDHLKLLIRNSSGSNVPITPEEASYVSYSYKLLDYLDSENTKINYNYNNLFDYTGLTPITFNDFNHNNPINIYKINNRYTTNFDVETKKHQVTNYVYIAPDGDDVDGNGTKDNPYLTFEQALSINDVNTIYLKNGTYYMGKNFTNGLTINSDINIISENAVLFLGNDETNRLAENGIIRIRSNTYCEGITFNGGRGLIVEVTTDTPTFNKCKFINSNQNGINFRGLGCYIVNCEAYNNELDGFNYHEYNNVSPTGIIEINCKSYNNGNNTNRSCNGSTVHDNGRIIRLKNEYYNNHGGNLADSESISYNFDILSYNSTNYTKNYQMYNTNYNSLTNSIVYLYNCLGSNSLYQLSALTNSYIYTDTNIIDNLKYKDSTSNIIIL